MTLHDLIATLNSAEQVLGNVKVTVIPVSDLALDGFYARDVKAVSTIFSLQHETEIILITED